MFLVCAMIGRGEGVESPTNFSKSGGLTGSQFLEGVLLGKEAQDVNF